MNFLYKLQRKFGKFAIPNLMRYIVILSGAILVLELMGLPLTQYLYFDRSLILQGQVWRVFTYIFLFGQSNIIFAAIALYFYYIIGESLEREWGSFIFNIFYFPGVLFGILGGFLFDISLTAVQLNTSMFLAFGTLFPNFTVLVFMIIPVKMKWLAILNGLYILVSLIMGNFFVLFGVANYILFFGKDFIHAVRDGFHIRQNKKRFRQKMGSNPNQFKLIKHQCTICGITDADDPDMEFRYCSKCDGYHEYCMDHLHHHEHIKDL